MAHRLTPLRGTSGGAGSLRTLHECRAPIPTARFRYVLRAPGGRCSAHLSPVEVWYLDANLARRTLRAIHTNCLRKFGSCVGQIARASRFGLARETFLRDLHRSPA